MKQEVRRTETRANSQVMSVTSGFLLILTSLTRGAVTERGRGVEKICKRGWRCYSEVRIAVAKDMRLEMVGASKGRKERKRQRSESLL